MAYVSTVPVFLVVGYPAGAISRRLMPTYERGCLQFVFLALLTVVNLIAALALIGAVEQYLPELVPESGTRVYLAPLFVAFAVGFLVARLRKHRTTVARRRRVVQPSGSYVVPREVRSDRPTPRPRGARGATAPDAVQSRRARRGRCSGRAAPTAASTLTRAAAAVALRGGRRRRRRGGRR